MSPLLHRLPNSPSNEAIIAEIGEFSRLAKEGGEHAHLYSLCREFYVTLFDFLDGSPHTVAPRELQLVGEFSGFAQAAYSAITENSTADLSAAMSGIAALTKEIRSL